MFKDIYKEWLDTEKQEQEEEHTAKWARHCKAWLELKGRTCWQVDKRGLHMETFSRGQTHGTPTQVDKIPTRSIPTLWPVGRLKPTSPVSALEIANQAVILDWGWLSLGRSLLLLSLVGLWKGFWGACREEVTEHQAKAQERKEIPVLYGQVYMGDFGGMHMSCTIPYLKSNF